jgi:hypothetical protein
MNKFKPGDKVRILPRKPEWANQYPSYVDEMLVFVGRTFTIPDGEWEYALYKNYSWHEDWLEHVVPPVNDRLYKNYRFL